MRKRADSPRRSSTRRVVIRGAIYFGLLMSVAGTSRPDVVTLNPVKDNTLYESETGALSNGAGQHLFTGLTNQPQNLSARRALMAFDVAAVIPTGSTVYSAELTLILSKSSIAGDEVVTLHRVLADWGEGESDATGDEGAGVTTAIGDATWIHRFFDPNTPVFWADQGGDFDPTARASQSVPMVFDPTPVSWGPNAAMTADVQDWLDSPSVNFGWMLIGREPLTQGGTAKRFDSRENPTPANRPQLVVDFDLAGAPTRTPTPSPTATATRTETPTATTSPTPQPAPTHPGKNVSPALMIALLSVAVLILIRRRRPSMAFADQGHQS